MNMNNATRVAFEELRSKTAASVGGFYTPLGDPLEHPARLIKISNHTDENILVSFDNLSDHDFIAANSYALYDFTANLSITPGQFSMPAHTTVYVKSEDADPNTGDVYLAVIYGSTH